MTTLNDEILRKTGGPTVNDGQMTHFGALVGESLNDAEFRFLGTIGGVGGTVNDRWLSLVAGGESVNEKKFAYWSSI